MINLTWSFQLLREWEIRFKTDSFWVCEIIEKMLNFTVLVCPKPKNFIHLLITVADILDKVSAHF